MLRSAVVCGIAATASGFVLTGVRRTAAVRRAGISASSVRSLRRNGLELRSLQAISSCFFSSQAGTLAGRFATAGSGRSAAFPSVGRTLIAAGVFGGAATALSYNRTYAAGASEKEKPIIAIGQMCSTNDIESNIRLCRRLCIEAKEQGACFLSLPECFEYMGIPGTGDALAAAQPLEGGPAAASSEDVSGSLFSRYQRLAKEHGLWLSLGGFHERTSPDDPKMYNTHAIVDAEGSLVAAYRKLHLFDVDYDGGFRESASTHKGGEALLVTDTPIGNIGVTVCYDLRFPEIFTALRRAGAHVILIPSAFMPTTGEAHWEALLRARAIETQCYVGAAAQHGKHNDKRSSFGHAMLVDPWGRVLGDRGAHGDGLVTAPLDFEEMEAIRTRMPVMSHRRPDVVHVAVGDSGARLRVVCAHKATQPAAAASGGRPEGTSAL